MKKQLTIVAAALGLALLPFHSVSQDAAIRPAHVAPLTNIELSSAKSGVPAYLPREWGSLIAVEKTGETGYTLFLQNEAAEVYLVRLIQRGDYLYLDTYDRGGVALVIRREP